MYVVVSRSTGAQLVFVEVQGHHTVTKIGTKDNLADLFTKGLDLETFTRLAKRVLNIIIHGITRIIPRARRTCKE